MPTLYITEYERAASGDYGGGIQAPLEPAVANQTVTISGASAQSSALNASTRLVRLHTDTACHVLVGTNPTATTSHRRMVADGTEFIGIPPGDSLLVAVIQGS